jgi:glycosyltransferase involved in cell wall biosynthesis
VESILRQDYHNYEIILIDDGSTDKSGKICDIFQFENPSFIHVVHKKNGGLSSARNAGLKVARGKYIMFLDSDDWIENGCLAKFAPLFINGYDLIMGRAWSIDNHGNKKSKLPYRILPGLYDKITYIREGLKDETAISFCCPFYLYRREYIEKNRLHFYEGIIHEDELWMPIALLRADTIYITNIYFYFHFMRDSSIMHSSNYEYSAISTLKICRMLDKELNLYPRKEVKWLRNRLAMLFLRAVPQLKNPKPYIKAFRRNFPLSNAATSRQKIKSFLYFLSPGLYCEIIGKIRGY